MKTIVWNSPQGLTSYLAKITIISAVVTVHSIILTIVSTHYLAYAWLATGFLAFVASLITFMSWACVRIIRKAEIVRGVLDKMDKQYRFNRITEHRQNQPLEELERKQNKAARKGYWTQEDIDLALAKANEIAKRIVWE